MDSQVFEHLAALNRNVDAAIDILRKLAEYRELQEEGFVLNQAYFREHLADANVSILEALQESEENAGGAAYDKRRTYEKKTSDPNDCYIEVRKREEERRQRGLPPLIGVRLEVLRSPLEADEELEDAEIDIASEDRSDDLRQKIIVHADDLRIAKSITKSEFQALIGLSAATSWNTFVSANAKDAWDHVTPRMFARVAQALGISEDELLQSS